MQRGLENVRKKRKLLLESMVLVVQMQVIIQNWKLS